MVGRNVAPIATAAASFAESARLDACYQNGGPKISLRLVHARSSVPVRKSKKIGIHNQKLQQLASADAKTNFRENRGTDEIEGTEVTAPLFNRELAATRPVSTTTAVVCGGDEA